jgi:hypothetical protein
MTRWGEDELRRIAQSEELEIAPVRRSGELRKATPIWVVRAGDELFVRGAYGSRTGWYRVARASGAARIRAGGVELDVVVEGADPAVHDAVDAAYREKYGRYASIVDSITTEEARALTLRLRPAS